MTHGKENQPCFFFCDLTDKKESFISTYPNMFLGLTPIPRSYYKPIAIINWQVFQRTWIRKGSINEIYKKFKSQYLEYLLAVCPQLRKAVYCRCSAWDRSLMLLAIVDLAKETSQEVGAWEAGCVAGSEGGRIENGDASGVELRQKSRCVRSWDAAGVEMRRELSWDASGVEMRRELRCIGSWDASGVEKRRELISSRMDSARDRGVNRSSWLMSRTEDGIKSRRILHCQRSKGVKWGGEGRGLGFGDCRQNVQRDDLIGQGGGEEKEGVRCKRKMQTSIFPFQTCMTS